jgi:hypothetical protein
MRIREADHGEPGAVGVDVAGRERLGAGVFEAADVVLDVGMVHHLEADVAVPAVGHEVGAASRVSPDLGARGTSRTGKRRAVTPG